MSNPMGWPKTRTNLQVLQSHCPSQDVSSTPPTMLPSAMTKTIAPKFLRKLNWEAGCPLLRALCEGWDTTKLSTSAKGQAGFSSFAHKGQAPWEA